MKTVGIIAEYNPFHNGHEYLIKKAKETTGADAVVVLMSGDFVQRGEPSIMDKYTRAKAALLGGADVILEIPVSIATSSAELYALGCISIFNQLGCIDYLAFGSEYNNLEDIRRISSLLMTETSDFQNSLKKALKEGMSYPQARQYALQDHLTTEQQLLLSQPNSILAIEYVKALMVTDSRIQPVCIKRVGNGYHDQEMNHPFSSATALRKELQNQVRQCENICTWNTVPRQVQPLYSDYISKNGISQIDQYSLLLKYVLMNEDTLSLCSYMDVNVALANRIKNCLNEFLTFSQFTDLLHTKDTTRATISRALLHILLGIRKFDSNILIKDKLYARVLGFNDNKKGILSLMKKNSLIPIITKITNEHADIHLLQQDIAASNLYQSAITDQTHNPFVHERSRKIIIV